MRKILFVLLMCVVSLTACTQHNTKNTITFLGIPVDGTKQEMIEQLQTKGFVYDSSNDCLVGEFNRMQSGIQFNTSNNKVWRVIVISKTPMNSFVADKVFNRFVDEFSNNEKYIRLNNEEIHEEYTLTFWRKACQNMLYFERGAVFAFKNSITEDGISEGVAIYSFYNEFDGSYGIVIFYDNYNIISANGEDL